MTYLFEVAVAGQHGMGIKRPLPMLDEELKQILSQRARHDAAGCQATVSRQLSQEAASRSVESRSMPDDDVASEVCDLDIHVLRSPLQNLECCVARYPV